MLEAHYLADLLQQFQLRIRNEPRPAAQTYLLFQYQAARTIYNLIDKSLEMPYTNHQTFYKAFDMTPITSLGHLAMRIALIIGAGVCAVIGINMVLCFVAYRTPFLLLPCLYTVVAFVPLVLLAPRPSGR